MFYRDEPPTKKEPVGRPQDEDQTVAFLKVAQFLQENDDEQITVNDLIEIMNEFLEESQSIAYGHTHMKARLKENFGDQIIITEISEKSNVVTLRGFFRGNHHGKGCGRKRVSIGQAIMQAARPRVLLAPLQIGLGVQLHHHFVSRFRIDSLHRLGFWLFLPGSSEVWKKCSWDSRNWHTYSYFWICSIRGRQCWS